MTSHWIRFGAALSAVLALVAGCYSGVLQNGYVWDDWVLFIHNPALRLEHVTWAMLSAPVMDGTTYFRPAVFLSFWAEFRFLGLDAARSHAINLVLHLANVSLVFLIATRLCSERGLAQTTIRGAIAASLYGLHPSLVEAVGWVSGRFDLLATFFVALALFVDLCLRDRYAKPAVLAVLFAGALGSKETGVILPLALLAQRLLVEHRSEESIWKASRRVVADNQLSVMALALVFLGYSLLRYLSFDALLHLSSFPQWPSGSFTDRLLFVLATLNFYLREIVYPFASVGPLHPFDAAIWRGYIGTVNVVTGIAAFAILIYGLLRRFASALMLASAMFALLPVLNIVPLTIADSIGCDRFLTLPLVFVALALSLVHVQSPLISRHRPLAMLLPASFAVWAACAAMITSSSVPQWKSDFTLWTWAYREHPQSSYARLQVSSAAISERRYDIAEVLFEKFKEEGALERSLQLNYGGFLIAAGDREEGRKYIEGALLAFPPLHTMTPEARARHGLLASTSMDIAFAYRLLAIADLEQGRFESALHNAEISVWYKPNFPVFVTIQALALMAVDRVDEGRQLFDHAMNLDLPAKRLFHERTRVRFVQDACKKWPEKRLKMCVQANSDRAEQDGI